MRRRASRSSHSAVSTSARKAPWDNRSRAAAAAIRPASARTVGSDFDRSTNTVDARVEVPMPWKSVFNAEARYFWDDYKHPNSLDFQGRVRRDERIEARAGFQKFFTPHLSTRIEYIYMNNDSNVENLFGASFYSFDRHVLSALLIYDF